MKTRDTLLWRGQPVEDLSKEDLIEMAYCLSEVAKSTNLRHERQISWYREMLRKNMDQ